MNKHQHKRQTKAQPGLVELPSTSNTAVDSGDLDHDVRPGSAESIRLCAYRRWENAGKPIGDGMQFWLEAEQELARGM
jgi:Protein of unknown function (DUF2934)